MSITEDHVKLFLSDTLTPFDPDDLLHSETAFNQCWHVSVDFQLFLDSIDIKNYLLRLDHYIGPPMEHAHPKWMSMSPEHMVHYVVLVKDKTYDFTYRQFDPECPVPLIQTLSELKENWKNETQEALW